jgi:hypothetical protein
LKPCREAACYRELPRILIFQDEVRRICLLGTSVNNPWSSAAGLPQTFG